MKKVLERTKKRVLAVLISAGVILGSLAAYTVAAADEGEFNQSCARNAGNCIRFYGHRL